VAVKRDWDEMIVEIGSIESMLKDLKANNEDEFKETEENAQVIHSYFCFSFAPVLNFDPCNKIYPYIENLEMK